MRAYLSNVRWGTTVLLATCVLGMSLGCDSQGGDDAGAVVGDGGEGGAMEPVPEALSFDSLPKKMAPGESRSVVVQAHPAGEYRVRFALLGDSGDASLDRTEMLSDPTGRAEVLLTAPTMPINVGFQIRAAVGSTVIAEAEVKVATDGVGSLEVEPKYAGQRELGTWVASARPGMTCAELTGNPPPDGEFVAEGSGLSGPLLEGLPAGRELAVTVRNEMNVSGCLDVPALATGEVRTVEVSANDVPVRLEGVDLKISLDLRHPDPPWSTLLVPLLDKFDTAVLGGSGDDLYALLDAMSAVARDNDLGVELDEVQDAGGWHGGLESILGDPRYAPIRTRLRTWYAQGVTRLDNSAELQALLAWDAGEAWLKPISFAGYPADEMGLHPAVPITWKAEAADLVLLGAELPWPLWNTYTQMAELQAAVDPATVTDLGTALASSLDCDRIGAELYWRAVTMMGDCHENCLSGICGEALGALVARGNEAVVESTSIRLSATATATIDENARPTAFAGQWVGTIDTGDFEARASGGAEGFTPTEDAEE